MYNYSSTSYIWVIERNIDLIVGGSFAGPTPVHFDSPFFSFQIADLAIEFGDIPIWLIVYIVLVCDESHNRYLLGRYEVY